MKKLSVGLLVLILTFTLPLMAKTHELSYCAKGSFGNGIHKGQGYELIDIPERIIHYGDYSSRVVCNHHVYGNYLYDNLTARSYEIKSKEECNKIEKQLRAPFKKLFTFVIDNGTNRVISFKNEFTSGCFNL